MGKSALLAGKLTLLFALPFREACFWVTLTGVVFHLFVQLTPLNELFPLYIIHVQIFADTQVVSFLAKKFLATSVIPYMLNFAILIVSLAYASLKHGL